MIKYGETSEKVKDLQIRLQRFGLNAGPIDGIFGPLTLTAWTKFEQEHLIDYKVVTDEEFKQLKELTHETPESHPSDEQSFLALVIPLAKQVMAKTGLPASISVGQAIIETGYGQEELAQNALNYHGIKAGFDQDPLLPKDAFPEWTGEIYKLRDDETNLSRFMVFKTVKDSFWTHDRWFCYWDHYHPYFAHAKDPYTFLKLISKHYATDQAYFNNVWSVIEKHNLTEIERDVIVNPISPWKELYEKCPPPHGTYKVAIMPGHGGSNPGAVNHNLAVQEATYNWREAEEIKRILEATGSYQVEICRQQNELLELDNFKERANETEADVCLCLHHNADKGRARGWWLFYVDKKPEYEKFVKVMEQHFKELPLYARGYDYAGQPFEQDWFHRVWNCIYGCKMPTILFESCFIDNDADCQWLKDGGYKVVAQKICDGVKDYLENHSN